MEGVLAICHFCELHGPSVLFTTRAYHSNPGSPPGLRSWYGPPDLLHRGPAKPSENCEGCTTFLGHNRAFISNDHDYRVSYLSTQHPLSPSAFSMVRHACVRSLSCEVCPGMEGPIYFGDPERGHVLSHTFFLKDSQARGFQRWYSVVLVSRDHALLLHSWTFLVGQFKELITYLQDCARKVYDREQSECSLRTIRLNSLTRMTTPDNFRRQRGNAKGRSLADVTGEPDIFRTIHRRFMWLLQASAVWLSERLVEGPPSQDDIVCLELQESPPALTENGQGSNLPALANQLGMDQFRGLVQQVVTGGQVVVRGAPWSLVSSTLHTLQELLPRGCNLVDENAPEYREGPNLLGLEAGSPLPVECKTVVVVDVTPGAITLSSLPPPPPKVPQLVSELEKVVASCSPPLVQSFVFALKETWMNKAKVMFASRQPPADPKVPPTKLLQVLGIQPHDMPLVEFWMQGLSQQYKSFVMASVHRDPSHTSV